MLLLPEEKVLEGLHRMSLSLIMERGEIDKSPQEQAR